MDELSVRIYGEKLGDYQTVNAWWSARHHSDLAETILPPLGVIVENAGEPVGALWCYECFGVGVAFFEFPITRPKTSLLDSAAIMMLAVEALVRGAKSHGDYSLFRAYPDNGPLAYVMERCGFTRAGTTKQVHMALRRD
ncbi:hypothetical protein WJU23_05200 [Prosthecobacter sp. SYSU 5D2]|uniref:hypothetical protein n=1 Tax=Prosthecobacter sp. SYSU 5D2 TaxID=3134134 RepID=UPI0031FEE2EF